MFSPRDEPEGEYLTVSVGIEIDPHVHQDRRDSEHGERQSSDHEADSPDGFDGDAIISDPSHAR